jgi:hypothetical protein
MRTAVLFLSLLATPALAEQVPILPATSQVELRAYGLGLLPLDGKFTRFHGILRYDPAKPGMCQAMLEIDAASLQMFVPMATETITGPEFLNAARYPDIAFDGACQGDAIKGDLRLHGQTHPFVLELDQGVATGRVRRADWGITARPFTAGSTIRIRVTMPPVQAGGRA